MIRQKKILIIEDEKDIARITKDFLTNYGYEVFTAGTVLEANKITRDIDLDFIVLDIMLPDGDGIEFCQSIRSKSNVPILILSARGSETDKILGLGFGADDYMTKPFSLSELAARIQAHLRRAERLEAKSETADVIVLGKLRIDKKAYSLWVGEKLVSLTAKEFELLYYMALNKNQVFTKSQLLDAVWGYESFGDENTIAVYISRIREKIEVNPSLPVYLKTVWGVGYKLSWEE